MKQRCLSWLVCFLLLCALPILGLANDGWVEGKYIDPRWPTLHYGLSVPAFSGDGDSLRMKAKYTADPDNTNGMLLEIEFLDSNGAPVTQFNGSDVHTLYVPYPQGHDAAMGYTYAITSGDGGDSFNHQQRIPQAIAFNLEGKAPGSVYRITWGDHANPKAAPWALIMSRMDWESPSYTYSVGTGSKKVTVTRSGKDVTFSGGEIADVVRFADQSEEGGDYRAMEGWHTESGSYTFHNVTLLDNIYVWAYEGEQYKITLDASVKGSYGMICALKKGAVLDLINNDIICCDDDYSIIIEPDVDSKLSITGNGKIFIGNGQDWSDENADGLDEVPIRIVMGAHAASGEEALEMIRKAEGNITVSYDQVKVPQGYPRIRSYCYYMPNPLDPWETEDLMDPATGERYELDPEFIIKKLRPGKGAMTEPVCNTENQLAEGALYRPLLVMPSDEDKAYYLRSQITHEQTGNTVNYEIHLVDSTDVQKPLPTESKLYIPYPDGMDENSAARYEVVIRHESKNGTEVFSTGDGTVALTAYGFCVPVASLSPFEITWNARSNAPLPPTGDTALIELYILLLTLGAVVCWVTWRRTRKA